MSSKPGTVAIMRAFVADSADSGLGFELAAAAATAHLFTFNGGDAATAAALEVDDTVFTRSTSACTQGLVMKGRDFLWAHNPTCSQHRPIRNESIMQHTPIQTQHGSVQ